jgi:hypothetical protein
VEKCCYNYIHSDWIVFNAQEQGSFSKCLQYSGFLPPFLSEGGFGEGAIFVNVWDKKKPRANGQCPEHSSSLLQCVIGKINCV